MNRTIASATSSSSSRNRGVLLLAAVFGILSAMLMFAFLNSRGGDDGIANHVCGTNDTYFSTNYNNIPCNNTNSASQGTAQDHAYREAIRATDSDIIIFTIGLGDGVEDSFLERVADGGVAGDGPCQDNEDGCRYYFAPTTDQLDEAFEAIAEQTHIALVR